MHAVLKAICVLGTCGHLACLGGNGVLDQLQRYHGVLPGLLHLDTFLCNGLLIHLLGDIIRPCVIVTVQIIVGIFLRLTHGFCHHRGSIYPTRPLDADALGIVAHLQACLHLDFPGGIEECTPVVRMDKVVVAAPKDITEFVVRQLRVESCLCQHLNEEVLDLLPPAAVDGMLEVGLLCKPCKVFLRRLMAAPAVTGHSRVDAGTDFHAHVGIDVIEEGVEVLAEHVTQSVVGHTLMEQGIDDVALCAVVGQHDDDLVRLGIEPAL